jgi:hypothetical protein
MIRSLSRRCASGALLAGLMLAPLALHAQGSKKQTVTADDIALRQYTLSMSNLQKLRQAMLNLKAYVKAHPGDTTWDAGADDPNQTLLESARKLDAIPPMKAALNQAGLTSRDYVLMTMAYFQAAMLAGVQDAQAQAHKPAPIKIPYNMNPANLEFVRAHKAEIEQLKLGEIMQDEDDSGH